MQLVFSSFLLVQGYNESTVLYFSLDSPLDTLFTYGYLSLYVMNPVVLATRTI